MCEPLLPTYTYKRRTIYKGHLSARIKILSQHNKVKKKKSPAPVKVEMVSQGVH